MKKVGNVLSLCLCATLVAGAAWGAAPKFKTDKEKTSYAIGVNMARQLKQRGTSFDPASMANGLKDESKGKSLLTVAETDAIMQKVRDEAQKKIEADRQKAAIKNKERGAAFMAENGKKEGVKTLPGGIQYRVLQAGDGEKPLDDDSVLCNYRGMLLDGTVFDASKPGAPSSFKVKKVIPGLQAALEQMPVGSKWELVIPPDKAYGERGFAPGIGPDETLIFEVELVGIK